MTSHVSAAGRHTLAAAGWADSDRPHLPGIEVGSRLGTGTDTAVFRARREGVDYAVKVITQECDEKQARRFHREGALLACLDHPGLVTIHEIGTTAGRPYLVMDLIEGRSLAELLRPASNGAAFNSATSGNAATSGSAATSGGAAFDSVGELGAALPEEQVLRIAAEVAEALTAAHRVGVVHRDVKPENIMITPTGRAQLIDFGLAGRTRADASHRPTDLAIGDLAIGTFAYAAPEQTGMLHRGVDGRADFYGLGVVMFECLTGRRPFHATDVGELIRLHLMAPVPDLRTLRPGISDRSAAIVAKLLAKDPDDRYQSGRGLLADLTTTQPETAQPETGQPEIGRPETAQPETQGFVAGTADTRGPSHDTLLVGRADELAQLRERWHAVPNDGGGVALVRGPAGSGKSRLVRELVATAQDAAPHIAVLRGTCRQDNGVPMGALRQAVDRYVNSTAPQAGVLRAVAGDGAALLRPFSPALADLLGLPETGQESGTDQLAEAIARLLIGIAVHHNGAILHLDDVQWVDDGTRRVLQRLVPLLADAPLLVLCTARDDASSAQALAVLGRDLAGVVDPSLSLPPLPAEAVSGLLAAQFGRAAVPKELVDRLARRAAGNPLAIVEYVRAVVDAGLLRPSWGDWILDEAGLDILALPDDVLQLVLRRVDGLRREARRVLTVAAVVGATFGSGLLAEVAGVPAEVAAQSIDEAVEHQLVEVEGAGSYRFLHDRIREALLADLAPDARSLLHRRIAEQLRLAAGPDTTDNVYEIAQHYLNGSIDDDPGPVVSAAAAAGALALRQSLPVTALDFLRRGARVAAERHVPLDAGYHADLGLAATRVGEYDLALHHLAAALGAETDRLQRARIHGWISAAHHLRWEPSDSLTAIRTGLAELDMPLPRSVPWLLVSSMALFLWGMLLGRLPRRWRIASGRRAERCRLGVELLAAGAQSAGLNKQLPLVIVSQPRALHLVYRLDDDAVRARSITEFGMAATAAGRLRHAQKLFHRATAIAASHGDPRLLAKDAFLRAIAEDVIRPPHADSGAALVRMLHRHGRWLDASDYFLSVNALNENQLLRGYVAQAAEWHRRALDRTGAGEQPLGAHFTAVAARIAALSGRAAESARLVQEIADSASVRPGDPVRREQAALAAVHVAVEQGDRGGALDAALAEFATLSLRPDAQIIPERDVWVYQAFGRVEQAYHQDGSPDPERLAQAEAAVKDLGRAARGSLMRAFHQAARAAVQSLRGDHTAALSRLGRLEGWSVGLDVPLLDYEIARVRARACHRLGSPANARRHAVVAASLADRHGWPLRARWMRQEFDLGRHHTGRPGRSAEDPRSARAVTADVHQRRMRTLYEMSLTGATVLDVDELTRIALDELVRIFGAERAYLLLDEVGTEPDAEPHLGPAELRLYRGRDAAGGDLDELTEYGSTLVARVHETGEPLVVTGSEQGAALGSQSTLVHGLRSIMVAPLALRGATRGVVYLDSRTARGIFTTDDVDLLTAITNHVAIALETARTATLERAVVAAEHQRDTAQSLHEAMAELTASMDPTQVARRLLGLVRGTLPAHAAILLRRRPDGRLTATGSPTIAGDGADAVIVDERDDPVLSALVRADTTTRGESPEAGLPLPAMLGTATTGWLAMPLDIMREGRGLLLVATEGRPFTVAEAEIATALTRQGQAALDNAMLFREVEELATRDVLTGVDNRRHFLELVARHTAVLRRYPEPTAAVMIDIDHFKAINDTHGHGVGDEVILAVAGRLAAVLRADDLLCRYGGEEFAVILLGTVDDAATRIADLLHAAVRERPIDTAAGALDVTISVGLACTASSSGELDLLLQSADQELYAAKRAGRDRVSAITHG